jgi:GNAT superfamily N-acetyltransferase
MEKREHLNVIIRPACETDTPGVMELSSQIWDGEDYVPYVWSEWLSDPQGRLVIADHESRVIGLGKLTRLSEEDWWLEGLRVHPEFEGRGIASKIHEYLMNTWIQIGRGSVRLGTASFRLPVHHLCDRLGFKKIIEFTPFVAPTLSIQSSASDSDSRESIVADQLAPGKFEKEVPPHGSPAPVVFKLVTFREITEATTFALQSPSLALSSGLMDLGWQWAPPREVYLARMIEDRKAWWWQERRGLLALDEEKGSKNEPASMIMLLACSREDVVDLLSDYRRLAASLGYQRAAWMAPLHPDLLPALQTASFERDWDASIFIYSRPWLSRP